MTAGKRGSRNMTMGRLRHGPAARLKTPLRRTSEDSFEHACAAALFDPGRLSGYSGMRAELHALARTRTLARGSKCKNRGKVPRVQESTLGNNCIQLSSRPDSATGLGGRLCSQQGRLPLSHPITSSLQLEVSSPVLMTGEAFSGPSPFEVWVCSRRPTAGVSGSNPLAPPSFAS